MGTSFSRNIENPIFSLRIVKVFANSPGFKAGLEPFLDFIIEIQTSNNEKVSFTQISDNSISSLVLADFSRIISENANKILIFSLFNVYSQKSRKVQIIPSRDWENSDSFLGILVRLEEIANSLEKTYRVLNVLKDSPAEKSGLLAESDFILGLTYNKYQDIKEFIEILEEEEEKDKEICVFNEKSGEVRHISLKINKDWGGKGILGCEFGFGIRNQLKPGLENVESSKEIVGEKEKSPGFEKSNNEDTSKHQKMMGISEKAKKLKIPPKNPFNYAKKTSFEKEKNEKDFLEIEFIGIPKYENPPRKGEFSIGIIEKISKKTDISEIKSNNSSFVLANILENEKSMERSETDDILQNKMKIMTKKYSFFSRKLNGDYIIRSEDLFRLDISIV